MAKIKDKKQYDAACARIEELLKVVSNNTPTDDKNYLELDLLSDLVADYEEEHFPVETPLLVDKTRACLGIAGGDDAVFKSLDKLFGFFHLLFRHPGNLS